VSHEWEYFTIRLRSFVEERVVDPERPFYTAGAKRTHLWQELDHEDKVLAQAVLHEILNRYGGEGWELVAVVTDSHLPEAIFKRLKQ
jgi:hypothetical protein